jgi:hypothetical protein
MAFTLCPFCRGQGCAACEPLRTPQAVQQRCELEAREFLAEMKRKNPGLKLDWFAPLFLAIAIEAIEWGKEAVRKERQEAAPTQEKSHQRFQMIELEEPR